MSTWREEVVASTFFLFLLVFLLLGMVSAADPEGPDTVTVQTNETKPVVAAKEINTSGGYIITVNLSSTTQNTKWKGIIGQVTGSFTLDDAGGATLYDWNIATIAGEVFATRNTTSLTWSSMQCANTTIMEQENDNLNHTSGDDNITRTFNDTTHSAMTISTSSILANTCPTLNTYVNNATQDTSFQEMVLTDSSNFTNEGRLVYSTIIENNVIGFNNLSYDFQMIVPEVGSATFGGITPYFLYIELS